MGVSTRISLTFCLLTVLSGCSREPRDASVAEDFVVPVVAQPVRTGTLRAVLHLSGVIVPAQGAEFLAIAPEPARVQDIPRAEGDAVASGEVLVRFSMPSAGENVARQTAEVARAQALLEGARLAQTRTRDFVERGLVARRELDTVDRDLEEAGAALARAQTALRTAESTAALAVIRAPFAGVIAARLKDPGDLALAAVTDPVLRLVDPRRLEVAATVPRAEAPRVLLGATARLASAGEPIRLSVAAVTAPATPATNMVPVRLVFAAPTTLTVDTPVQVDVDAEERAGVVFVPPEAVVGTGANAALYVAVGSQAQRRPVTLGIADDERVEITSGVNAGELVITRGHTNLAEGAAISVEVQRP